MLAIESAPLPPDVCYVMDEALNEGDITPFTHGVLSFYGNRPKIAEIVDRERPREWQARTGAMCQELDGYAHALSTDIPEEQRRAFFAASLIREPPLIEATAECLAGWHIEDSTVGGCLESHRRGKDIRLDRQGMPTKRLRRKLVSPEACRRYVKITAPSIEGPPHRASMAKRLRTQQPWPRHRSEADTLLELYEEARVRHVSAQGERWRAMAEEMAEEIAARVNLKPRIILPKQRKTLKRAAAHACATVGERMTRDFVAGRRVSIEGQRFAFMLRAEGSLTRIGHSAIRVEVLEAGILLCNLCLFWENVPALDQMVALALHVEAGEEGSLIETGNPYAVTVAGAEHPIIGERVKAGHRNRIDDAEVREFQQQVIEDWEVSRRPPRQGAYRNLDHIKIIRGAYQQRYVHLYRDPLWTFIWGQDAARARAFGEVVQ